MNVLSLFDGMSCGQQALERAGIKVDNYYASEIDKYAIQVTMANYPNTKQLGSVTEINGYSLPKIDLLIGGSPCQSFSFAGKRNGMSTKCEIEILTLENYLQLRADGYEFEGESYLFWEYMRLLNEIKPKYFLLENVMMGEKWEKVLNKAIGVKPIMINSSLVSGQNRKRLYWTNIGMIKSGLFGDLESIIQQPKDKGILLKDILENEVDEKYFLSERMISGFEKNNINHKNKGNGFIFKPKDGNEKAACLRANAALNATDNSIIVYNNRRLNETIEKHKDKLENGTLIDSYNQTIHKDKSITISTRVNASHNTHIVHSILDIKSDNVIGGDFRKDEGFRWRDNGKSGTLKARARIDESCGQLAMINTSKIRRLTPIECERLQTVKDNYTKYVSDSQRYKMIGNGWTVDVISYIFSYI
jgi:DNA (cytosine-5)-methyltransferase 3A